MKEKLSALMDGELNELEERHILDALAKDAGLRATWERYHLMRAAITRQLDIVASPGLVDRVYARLQDSSASVARSAYPRLAAGLAVAAGVGALAIFGIQSLQSPSSSTVSTPLAANQATSTEPPEESLNAYLVGHNEVMPTAGMGGMLPYVRVVTYDRDK